MEAGAHVGSDTRAMARRWRAATIHAFEPVPELFELLEQNVGNLAGVSCHRLALGTVTGAVPMWLELRRVRRLEFSARAEDTPDEPPRSRIRDRRYCL